ncbi:MAG: hypothetical protein JWN46_3774 [Acidimicrobiales bacterium]|nr:hypothetical protein [Acidimicrobiales bacterium]
MLKILKSRRPAAIALCAALVIPACATHHPRGPTGAVTAPRPTPPPSPARPPTPEQQAADAYRAAQQALHLSTLAPNPSDPRLAQLLAGPQLARTTSVLAELARNRIAVRLRDNRPPGVRVLGVSLVTPQRAVVRACVTDDAIQIHLPDKRVVNDAVSSTLSRAELWRIERSWKLMSQQKLRRWNDLQGCAR